MERWNFADGRGNDALQRTRLDGQFVRVRFAGLGAGPRHDPQARVAQRRDPAAADAECDLLLSIECAARRQKWSDVDQTLTLQMKSGATDAGSFHVQAWEKGISRIHPCMPARETKRSVIAAAPQSEDVATVGGRVP